MKNILITGGAGYIGSHTATVFLEQGYNVTVYDDLSTGYKEAIPTGADFIQGEIHDTEKLNILMRKKGIDGIIHFAAKIIVPESITRPLEYYDNNTGGVLSVLKATLGTDVKNFVFSSTAAVYGDVGSDLISETAPIGPLNPYGNSKYFSECIIRDFGKAHGMNNVILRYFNVAGASSKGDNGQRSKVSTHLIKLASEAAIGIRPSLNITGTDFNTPDGTGIRDYIHVEDLADLHALAYSYLLNGGKSDVFNCGYSKGHSVREVIETMMKVSGKKFPVFEVDRRPGDAATLVADNKKIKSTFNWVPKRDDLELICKSAYLWEVEWQKHLMSYTNVKTVEFSTAH